MSEDQKQAVGLAVKLPFTTQAEFLGRYGANLTKGGLYLRTKALKAPGTLIDLTVKIESGEVMIQARAVVKFVTGAKTGVGVPGMGLKFLSVDDKTQRFLESMTAAMPHARSEEPPLPKNVGDANSSPDAVPRPPPPPAAVTPLSQPPAPLPSMTSGRVVVEGDSAQLVAPAFEAPKAEPPRTGPIIGIDLGTTNSCVAMVRDGKPEVLPSREGYRTVPSVIALSARGKLVVGHAAKAQLLTNPKQTVYGAKRLVGRAFDSETVQHIKERFSYEICASDSGDAAVRLADKVFTLQQISALLLKEVKDGAEKKLGEPVHRAVITVPAYYNDNQRQAVREAGRLAGLHVERIVNEPTAAALAYGYGRQLSQRVLVYDLGGGTFDASVLELNDNVYEVVSTGGDTFLGGIDFDGVIVDWLLKQFEQTHGLKFKGDRVAQQRIADAAERAKIALSERLETRVHVPFVTMIDNKPYDLDATLTREQMVGLTYPLVERTLATVREVLERKNLKPSDIDEVILVGGQSRAPLVREQVEAFFGKPPSRSVHPDEAVATGAALLAHALLQKEGLVLIDVLPMAIGVGLPGGYFKPVIERNASLPTTKKYMLSTTRDGQKEIEVTVFQGDQPHAQANEYLGTLKLAGLPARPRGALKVEVSFEVTNECLLKLKAREESSGAEVEAVFSTKDTPAAVKEKLAADEPPAPTGFMGWLKRLFGGAPAA